MLHSVSGTTSHLPGTVYGLCLKIAIICGSKLSLRWTCRMLGKWRGNLVLGPRKRFAWIQGSHGQSDNPEKLILSIDLRLNLIQYWLWKDVINNCASYFWRGSKEKGECRRCEKESEEDSKDNHLCVWWESSACVKTGWECWQAFVYIAAPVPILNVKQFFRSVRGITGRSGMQGNPRGWFVWHCNSCDVRHHRPHPQILQVLFPPAQTGSQLWDQPTHDIQSPSYRRIVSRWNHYGCNRQVLVARCLRDGPQKEQGNKWSSAYCTQIAIATGIVFAMLIDVCK